MLLVQVTLHNTITTNGLTIDRTQITERLKMKKAVLLHVLNSMTSCSWQPVMTTMTETTIIIIIVIIMLMIFALYACCKNYDSVQNKNKVIMLTVIKKSRHHYIDNVLINMEGM